MSADLDWTTSDHPAMAPKSFLDFPINVREQIYADLLVPPAIEHGDEVVFSDDICTDIMYTSRQIYQESSDVFYTKNLFVVFNYVCCPMEPTDFWKSLYRKFERLAICVHHDLRKLASCTRFAMTMEAVFLTQVTDRTDSTGLVITAQALPFLMDFLKEWPSRGFSGSVVQFRVHNTYRYSVQRFSELTFGHLRSAICLPDFKAVSIQGPIDSNDHRGILSKLPYNQETLWADFTEVLSLQMAEQWEVRLFPCEPEYDEGKSAIDELQLILRQVDFAWDFHRYLGFQSNPVYDQAFLFQSIVDVYWLLVLAHLTEAKRHPATAVSSYLHARRAAEQGITYLNRDDRFLDYHSFGAFPEDGRAVHIDTVNRRKSKLSLKAAKACIKLGDTTAAMSYIMDASKYDPEMHSTTQELLLKLAWKGGPRQRELPEERKGRAVLWKEEWY